MPLLELPLFPLHVVLFPGMRLPLHIFEDRYKLMIGTCMVTDRTFGVTLIQSGQEVAGPAVVHSVGTTAQIMQIERLPEGRMNLVAVGVNRFRIVERLPDQPYAMGRVELYPDVVEAVPETLTRRVAELFRRYLQQKGFSDKQAEDLRLPDEPLALSYVVASALKTRTGERQQLLASRSLEWRLRRELSLLEFEVGGSAALNVRSFSLN